MATKAGKSGAFHKVLIDVNEYAESWGFKPDTAYELQITREDYSFWQNGSKKCTLVKKLIRNFGLR